jgi:hypothetical protein
LKWVEVEFGGKEIKIEVRNDLDRGVIILKGMWLLGQRGERKKGGIL